MTLSLLQKQFILFTFFLVFIPLLSQSQYAPFYHQQRQLDNYSFFEQYNQLIDQYNKDKNASALRQALDSLSQDALADNDYLQYLFMQNERSNFFKTANLYDEGFQELHSAMQLFASQHDTMHLEYAVSLRMLRGLLTRSSQTAHGEEELLQSQLTLLYQLNQSGEPLTNTLVDYGLFLNRAGRRDAAIDTLWKARNSALAHNDLSSLALSDYTIISNLGSDYDLQKTTLDVLKTDLELFSAATPSIPILIYSSYFNYILGNKYAEWYNDIENAVLYTRRAIACLDTMAYPTWALKASCHSNMALFAGKLQDADLYHQHFEIAKEIASNRPMSAYNQSLAFSNLAEASLTFSPDTTLALLATLDSLPGAASFADHSQILYLKALIARNELIKATRVIENMLHCLPYAASANDDICEQQPDTRYQIQFAGLHRDILEKEAAKNIDNLALIDSIAWLISVESDLYTEILQKDVYGFETSPLGKKYREFLWPALDFLFKTNSNNQYDELIAGLIFASKASQLSNTRSKLEAQKQMESDSTQFDALMANVAQIQHARNQIYQAENDSIGNEWRGILNTLLVESLVKKNRMDASPSLTSTDEIPTRAQLTHALLPNEGVMELLTSDSSLVYYFVDSKGILMGRKDISDLKGLIRQEVYRLKTGGGSSVLGNIIFDGMEERLSSITHLTVIPDQELSRLAFEWMQIPGTGQMLVESHQVSYSYSIALWYQNRTRKLPAFNGHMLAIAPLFYDPGNPQRQDFQFASRYRGEASLYPLYSSLNEIETIGILMQENLSEIVTLTGQQATHSNVINHLKGASVVHFATHGLVNKDLSERSGLFLHPGREANLQQITDESFLSLGELINTDLDAQLVVLSACSSGTGLVEDGEGVMALPRGFILAGVPQVVATLWNVNDGKTRDFMISFYQSIQKGYSTATALQLAKQEMIRRGYLPLDWAAFILVEG